MTKDCLLVCGGCRRERSVPGGGRRQEPGESSQPARLWNSYKRARPTPGGLFIKTSNGPSSNGSSSPLFNKEAIKLNYKTNSEAINGFLWLTAGSQTQRPVGVNDRGRSEIILGEGMPAPPPGAGHPHVTGPVPAVPAEAQLACV